MLSHILLSDNEGSKHGEEQGSMTKLVQEVGTPDLIGLKWILLNPCSLGRFMASLSLLNEPAQPLQRKVKS